MSPIYSPVSYRPPTGTIQNANPYNTPSRADKTKEIFTRVIPSAVGTGLSALEVSGTATEAGALAASSSSSAAVGSILGTAGGAATIVGGLYGAYDLAANWGASTPTHGASSGMAVGAAIGTMINPGIGTAIGAAIGTIAGGLIGAITAGKHKDQKVRDQMREFLVQNGVLDSNYRLALADGTTYNMGLDGGPRAEFGGHRPYETDPSNPLAKYAISWVNPLIEFLAQGNQKIKTDFVGYFANAALSNARTLNDVRQNVNTFMRTFGISDEALAKAVVQAAQGGKLDPSTAEAYLNGIRERANPSFMGTFDQQPQTAATGMQAVDTQTNPKDGM